MTKKHSSTVRMPPELAERLSVISQVLDISQNQLVVNAIRETIMFYEGDQQFQTQRQDWLKHLNGVSA